MKRERDGKLKMEDEKLKMKEGKMSSLVLTFFFLFQKRLRFFISS